MSDTDKDAVLRRLRELEAESTGRESSEVLELMEELASDLAGAKELVLRYAASGSRTFLGALSFVLAQRSFEPSAEDWTLLHQFLQLVGRPDEPHTLQNCATALQRRVAPGAAWSHSERAPTAVFNLLKACLTYSGPEEQQVRHAALQVLVEIQGRQALGTAFAAGDLGFLRRTLASMSPPKGSLLEDELRHLASFIAGP